MVVIDCYISIPIIRFYYSFFLLYETNINETEISGLTAYAHDENLIHYYLKKKDVEQSIKACAAAIDT